MGKNTRNYRWVNLRENDTPYVECKVRCMLSEVGEVLTRSFCLDKDLLMNAPYYKKQNKVHPTYREVMSEEFNLENYIKDTYENQRNMYYPSDKVVYLCEVKTTKVEGSDDYTSESINIYHIKGLEEDGSINLRDVTLFVPQELKQALLKGYLKIMHPSELYVH